MKLVNFLHDLELLLADILWIGLVIMALASILVFLKVFQNDFSQD